MADNSVSIEVKANTAAAVTEVAKLSDAMRANTTAATVAGSAQEQLSKDVAVTASRQREATEAVRAAKQALETHNATVAAFGARSEQAAQSAAKLAAAEREAAKAATVAADALAKTAKEAQAVATSEKELSPATKRATAQLTRMGEAADRTAHELNKMELQQKRGSAGFDVMGFAGSKLMGVLGPAALGGSIVALAGWIGEAAEKTLQYETALANLPFSLDGARKATRGLVSEQMLVASAASASSLKVTKTAADFELLAGASVKLAQKLGQPSDQLLTNLVTALGRGSTELLDNAGVVLKTAEAQERYAASIGVSVSALTDEQKASAFKVEAMKAILKAADETTIAYDSNAAALVRLKVTAGDTWDAITRAAANGAGATVQAMGDMSKVLFHDEEWISLLVATANTMDNTWSPAFARGAASVSSWAAEVVLGAGAIDNIRQMIGDPSLLSAMDAANDKERAKRDLLSEEADFAERMQKALVASEAANTAFLDAQAAAAITYGPAAPDKAKRKGGAKKKAVEFSDPDSVRIARTFDGSDDTGAIASAAPEAAAEGRAEQEAALFAQSEDRYRREAELLEAQGQREAERVDAIFMTLEVEDEAEIRRQEMQDQRLNREQEYARWQARNARTAAQREQAETRLVDIEHKKRIVAITRAAAEERKVLEARQQIVGAVTGQVTSLAAATIAGIEGAVNGQKGALARGLADWTKDLAVRSGLKALEEFMLAAASAASYNYPAAAMHSTAGGMALAVAAAAGGASAGLGAAASTKEAAQAREEAAAKPGGSGGGGGSGGSSGTSGSTERLERLEVPVSYRDRGTMSAGPAVVVNIRGPVTSRDARHIGEQTRRALDQSKAQGRRT